MTIINKLERALQLSTFAGDTRNAKILWLASFTRYSDKPVSVLIKGSSGSGKSHLLNTVLKFIPEAEYQSFTGISEKAIAYMSKDSLKNKILAIQEFSGLQNHDGNTLLRSLLSENKIRYETVVNDSNSKFTTQKACIEGPVALFMTTTEKSIHPEDENRMISLTVDESLEHKRNVLKEKGRTFNEGKKASEDFSELHAISENYFKNKKDVLISFVDQIADNINLDSPQIYRDFDKILSLIETHALLHQEDREKTADNKVIATLEDYEVIWNLIEPVLELSSKKKITKDILRLVEVIKEHTESTFDFMKSTPREMDNFNTSNYFLAEKLGMTESAISRLCKKAKNMGLIINHEKIGNPAFYTVIKDPMMLENILPHPQQLQLH